MVKKAEYENSNLSDERRNAINNMAKLINNPDETADNDLFSHIYVYIPHHKL